MKKSEVKALDRGYFAGYTPITIVLYYGGTFVPNSMALKRGESKVKKLLFPILALILALGLIMSTATPASAATETLRPNAAGDQTAIASQSPASGAHWEKVDEASPDTTTYVYTSVSTSYQRDLYNLPAHSVGSGTINFITVYARCYWAGTADPAQASIKIAIKSGVGSGAPTTVSESAEITHSDNQIWEDFSNQWNTNPATGSAWTWDEIDNLQIGVALREALSGGPLDEECTQVYVVVDYTPAAANTAPVLSGGGVSPDPGYFTTPFTYSVTYTDADNEPPTSITVSLDGCPAQVMNELNPPDIIYTDGKVYFYTTSGLLKDIPHTYEFDASDGTDPAAGDINPHSGPTVNNSPPVMSTATITSSDGAHAYETSTLTASGVATDADSDALGYEYDWWVGSSTTGQTGTTLSGTHFNKGDSVLCKIRAYDASTYSNWMDSNTIPIENSDPDAVDDPKTVMEDSIDNAINVLDNDSCLPDVGETLSVTGVSGPPNGTAAFTATGVTYTPDADYFGPDSFDYTIDDGNGGTDTATVNVTVIPVNDPPDAVNDDYNVKVNSVLHIAAPGVLGNDTDVEHDPLNIPHLNGAHHGIVVLWGDGHFNYTPEADFIGTDDFTYYVSDGTDESSATVNLYVDDWPVYNLNTGQGYDDIQPAIDDATPGDTIMVAAGTYHEFLTIDKSLTLQSEGDVENTIIEDGTDHIIISLDGETVVFNGFTVTGATGSQIRLAEVKNGSSVTIKNSIIHGGTYGIFSYGLTVNNGTVNIEDNEFSNSAFGIYFVDVVNGSEVNITGNTVTNNTTVGIFFEAVDGSSAVSIIGNTVTNNVGSVGGIGFGTGIDFTNVSANFNNIVDNALFGVYNNGPNILDAENNWWGDASGPSGVGLGTGDVVGNNVDYDPWLGAQVENVKAESITGAAPYTVSLDSVLTVTGTTSGDVTIILSEYADNPHPEAGGLPSNMLPGYFDIWVSNPAAINWPMYVKQSYNDADVALAGVDESSLRMHYFTAGVWQECSDTNVNTGANFIWANMIAVEVSGSPVASGGSAPAAGGGGGGGFLRPRVTGLLAAPILELEPNGVIPVTCRLKTANSRLTLNIAKGTKLLDSAGKPLGLLSAALEPSPPPPPSAIILAYNLGQSGATFKPAITLTLSYDPTTFPEGVAAEDLYIAYWDGAEWVPLETKIDTMEREVSCQTVHFTIFALIAHGSAITPPAPAAFSVSSLSIQPLEVQPQKAVTITVSVANTGGTEGSYSVVLRINGIMETEKSVTVAAGGSQSVSFSVTKEEAGSYSVDVNGLSGSFTVAAAASSTPPEEAKPPISWWIWVIAGVVVAGLITFFLVRRMAY